MRKITAKTPRIILRPFALRDAAGFYELNSDPEVLLYTGDKSFASIFEAKNFIRDYKHYEQFGYGRWAVFLASTEEFMGFCGLNFSQLRQEVDLGFRFHRKFWGQGFATEAGFAALRVGFSTFQIEKIVGRASPKNRASLRVLEKLGMTFEKKIEESGEHWIQMSIYRDDFGVFYE